MLMLNFWRRIRNAVRYTVSTCWKRDSIATSQIWCEGDTVLSRCRYICGSVHSPKLVSWSNICTVSPVHCCSKNLSTSNSQLGYQRLAYGQKDLSKCGTKSSSRLYIWFAQLVQSTRLRKRSFAQRAILDMLGWLCFIAGVFPMHPGVAFHRATCSGQKTQSIDQRAIDNIWAWSSGKKKDVPSKKEVKLRRVALTMLEVVRSMKWSHLRIEPLSWIRLMLIWRQGLDLHATFVTRKLVRALVEV